jgi:hypothetical protein
MEYNALAKTKLEGFCLKLGKKSVLKDRRFSWVLMPGIHGDSEVFEDMSIGSMRFPPR